jgi:N-succinyldiaminopimelate aminotransferase
MVGDAAIVSNYLKIRLSERKVLPNNVQRASAYAWMNYEDVARSRELYRQKFEIVRDAFQAIGRPITLPDGTFYCWLDISELNPSDETVALELAKETGILTFPGSYFSVVNEGVNPGAGFIRIALIDTVEATRKTVQTLTQYITNYRC